MLSKMYLLLCDAGRVVYVHPSAVGPQGISHGEATDRKREFGGEWQWYRPEADEPHPPQVGWYEHAHEVFRPYPIQGLTELSDDELANRIRDPHAAEIVKRLRAESKKTIPEERVA